MRIIKFRAWDEINNEMTYQTTGLSGLSNYLILQRYSNVMQFTGKKDADEKEIYDGDVVSVHQFLFDGNEVEKEWIAEVVYIDELCCFGLKVLSGDFALSHTGFDNYEEMPPFSFSEIYGLHEESFKVLYNVFEKSALVGSF